MSRSRTPSTRVAGAETSVETAGQPRHHRVVLTGLLALIATLAGLCVPVAAAQARATSAAPPASYLTRQVLSDNFNRTVRSGWGAAPLGGKYLGYGSNGKAMAVAGNAYFSGVASGHSRVQRSSVISDDALATTTINLSRIPRRGSWVAYVGLELRVQSDGRAYSATVRVGTRGRARLLVDRRPARGRSSRLTSRTLPALTVGRTYTLQAAVVGTRLWTRLYQTGGHAGSWLTAADSSRSAIRTAGRIGIVLATVGARRTWSSVRFGSLHAYAPTRTASAPTPPVSTPPSSTPPSSTPPSSTPPSSTPPSSTPPSSTPPSSTPPSSTPPSSTPPSSTPPSSTPPSSTPPSSTPPSSTPPSSTPPSSTPPSSTPPSSTPPSSTPPSSTPPSSTPPSSTPPSSTPPSSTPPSSTPPSSTPPATTTSHADQVIANAGAAPLGSTSYAVPADAIVVSPTGSDSTGNGSLTAPYATVSKALSAAKSGSTVVLRGGVYHESVYVRASLQVTIQSYPGETVWFDGSVPVSSWTQDGNDWVHSGWDAQFDHSASFTKGSDAGGFVNSAYPMAAWPDQVFVDGVQLQQVAANPSAGEFAVDYANKLLIVGSDPSGHAVRASDQSQAFVVAGQATLRGFGIRRYATSLPQMGTLYLGGSGGNTVQNVVVDNNAGQGLASSSPSNVVDHVSLTANGMSGMSNVRSNGAVIENSLITGNNTQHFNAAPSAAGLKVTRLDGVVVRDNLVQNNLGITGIWTDENVTHFTITGNVVRNNGSAYGILAELSDTGIVANNTVSGVKYGITAYDSGDIAIYNNDVASNTVWDIGLTQDDRWQPGKGTAGPRVQPSAANPWLVQNVVIANNNFGRANGMFQFYVLDKQTNRSADSMNLMVAGNQFGPRANSAQPWVIGWGMADNTTVHCYASATTFNSGEQKSWQNAMATAGTGYAAATPAASVAQPLPADVAAAIGQSAGVQHVGTF